MFLNLVDENDGIADYHSEKGQDSQFRHKAHGRTSQQHAPGHPDKSQRCREHSQYHLFGTSQLEHKQRHNDENHHGNRL